MSKKKVNFEPIIKAPRFGVLPTKVEKDRKKFSRKNKHRLRMED